MPASRTLPATVTVCPRPPRLSVISLAFRQGQNFSRPLSFYSFTAVPCAEDAVKFFELFKTNIGKPLEPFALGDVVPVMRNFWNHIASSRHQRRSKLKTGAGRPVEHSKNMHRGRHLTAISRLPEGEKISPEPWVPTDFNENANSRSYLGPKWDLPRVLTDMAASTDGADRTFCQVELNRTEPSSNVLWLS